MIQIFVWKRSGAGAGIKRQLYVPADTSFNITISNPLFSDFGTFSYPLTVPYEENKHIFDFPGDGDHTKKSFSFELFQNYELFLQGDVEVVNAQGIEIYLKAGKSSYTSKLKSSFLDEKIDNHLWGIGVVNFAGSLNAIYPAYDYIAAPVKAKDKLYNDYNFDNNSIANPCPAAYVRFIIDRILEVFELDLAKDDLAEFSDFNRLAIWCAKKRITYFGSPLDTNFATWMPHVSAFDLLKDLQNFGILLYFNPFLYQAELLLYKNIVNAEPADWSDKYVRTEHFDPLNPKRVKLSFKGEDEDILNPDQYDVPQERTVYGSLANLPDPNVFLTASPDEVNEVWLFQENAAHRRFYRRKSANPDKGPLYNEASIFDEDGLFLTTSTDLIGNWPDQQLYLKIGSLSGQANEEYTNSSVSTTQPNPIVAVPYIFPVLEGEILRTLRLTVWIKASATTGAKLHVELGILRDEIYTPSCVYVEDVKNTTFEYKTFYARLTTPITLIEGDRLVLRLSCLSANERTITLASRREENGMDFFPFVRLDSDFYEWREVSALGALETGFSSSETEEITVNGSVPINDLVQMGGGLFEIPVSSMDPKDVQTDFAYVIYRGKKIEVSYPNVLEAGYFNFDNRDLKSEPFDTVASLPTPNFKLRWREEAGLLEDALYDFITHKAFKYREKRKVFKLRFTDLLNHPIYKPVMVDGVVYYIKSIAIPVHMTRGLGDSTVELISK